MNDLHEEAAVVRVATMMGLLVDQRDWDGATALFTDLVEVD